MAVRRQHGDFTEFGGNGALNRDLDEAQKKTLASTEFCRYIRGHDLEAISLVLYTGFSCLA